MKKKGELAQEKILDSAEALFSQRGFYGVTLREITKLASVDTALANYYFGSKQKLFDTVMMRRAQQLNDARLKALNELESESAGEPLDVEEIIKAFTYPMLQLSQTGGSGWKNYLGLIAQMTNTPKWGGQVITDHFDPLVRRFIEALKRAMPDIPEEEIYWSYHFLSGAMMLTFAETGRIDNLSDGLCKSEDVASIQERLPPFIAAGFTELRNRYAKKDIES